MIFSDDLKYVYLSIEEYCNLKGIKRRCFFYKYKNKVVYEKLKGSRKKFIKINEEKIVKRLMIID
ncbi:hypothetical protein BXA09_04905 [Campylobacter upsaliensis]|uniref:Helix-turn-helix domain-containing protein n=1 Tax=Campylobacter upsaliensis JV21 TaxID=888826 RepID=A0A828QSK7_CAMUP|nr:hypothetical protein [Campylobacter upsaliensis]EAI4100976.1 hypothetical protein [Campylobacter jejuni]EAH5552981.1 hypothetical protein [Campylobacter upsaliensis]EAH8338468.1 hypothetical protein [Campylobacter upsaliensis]EAI0017122.1 hypothetical protein [Campylobacter upsaliensis]EAI0665794.1 hypothetical protein [Campylobacter upsaliensis]